MSDEGERTCPLCAEEMDLTDRQLKPCKCGYEICVWCWHHIMDMAEKDDTEGRCPACRSSYDKDKVVGMAAGCERLVAEISSEKKMKSQRAKPKSTEGRKQLSSVRVIQRNLVYIVGLPLNLAEEELLQRKEYFGQYGKVLKVSMSRTAAGVIQQFPNNTCSVYITYLKEEEAVRCIQSAHGYALDGRTLKACFGTTKYCHAWLRNVPCTNPDCLYLHEVGSQEDSFTKDEIISAYTRSRVQQITGATNNMQRRSGNVLPPPVEDHFHESAASVAKPIIAAAGIAKSPPNGSSCRSLPAGASWGTRAPNHPPQTSLPCSNGPSKQKNDTLCGMSAFSSVVKSANHASSLHNDTAKKSFEESQTVHAKGRSDQLRPSKQNVGFNSHMPVKLDSVDGDTGASVGSRLSGAPTSKYFDKGNEVQSDGSSSSSNLNKGSCFTDAEKMDHLRTDVNSCLSGAPASKYFDKGNEVQSDGSSSSSNLNKESCFTDAEVDHVATGVNKMQSLSPNTSSLNINNEDPFEKTGIVSESSSVPQYGLMKSGGTESCAEQSKQSISSAGDERSTSLNTVSVRREGFDLRTGQEVDTAVNFSSEVDEDVLSFDNQRTKDPEVVVSRLPYASSSASSPYLSNHPRVSSPLHGDAFGSVNSNSNNFLGGITFSGDVPRGSDVPMVSSGHPAKLTGNGGSDFSRTDEIQKQIRLLGMESSPTRDIGESSIISNILSMDFDTWDESLTSPQNLAKLLGDTEQQPVSLKVPNWKVHNKNQSRFSFARQDENNSYKADHSFGFSGPVSKNNLLAQDVTENRDSRDVLLDRFGLHNGYSSSNFEGFDKFNSGPSIFSKSSVSRTQVSVPPGFSVPSRAPPPGFSSHNRGDQLFGNFHGNHLPDTSALLENSYQSPSSASIGSPGDLEFMDPAILAVGRGRLQGGLINGSTLDMRSSAAPQVNAFENEARLHLLMQRSLYPHQNLRYGDGDSFASLNDSYGITSKMMDQPPMNISQFAQLSLQQSRSSRLPGQWDGWNDVQGGNGLGMAELLRNNERLGYNKFYNGYEESKYRMPNSGDLYNRTYGV